MKPARRLITFLFAAAAALLLVSMIATYRAGLVAIHANRKMATELEVSRQLEDFLSTLTDIETGQRGYLLTADESYLEPYRAGLERLQSEKETIRQLRSIDGLNADRLNHVIAL